MGPAGEGERYRHGVGAVSQPWAGGTWGAQVIPRVGTEVLVTHQDGDPDQSL